MIVNLYIIATISKDINNGPVLTMESEEAVTLIVLCSRLHRRRKRRRLWVHPILKDRSIKGIFYILYSDLREHPHNFLMIICTGLQKRLPLGIEDRCSGLRKKLPLETKVSCNGLREKLRLERRSPRTHRPRTKDCFTGLREKLPLKTEDWCTALRQKLPMETEDS
ncbi:hypothetical protein PR048_033023 [Dryococelus australis]|uniref:Uncharacterized protein n=1 Tax=Dryococelus australis TaxID=614101 RepID=A0ABQ9G3W6_9NEOP|nr:hypothetical protein PR048_033023 [Dryococelus australis]